MKFYFHCAQMRTNVNCRSTIAMSTLIATTQTVDTNALVFKDSMEMDLCVMVIT